MKCKNCREEKIFRQWKILWIIVAIGLTLTAFTGFLVFYVVGENNRVKILEEQEGCLEIKQHTQEYLTYYCLKEDQFYLYKQADNKKFYSVVGDIEGK